MMRIKPTQITLTRTQDVPQELRTPVVCKGISEANILLTRIAKTLPEGVVSPVKYEIEFDDGHRFSECLGVSNSQAKPMLAPDLARSFHNELLFNLGLHRPAGLSYDDYQSHLCFLDCASRGESFKNSLKMMVTYDTGVPVPAAVMELASAVGLVPEETHPAFSM